jgi:hypothetical protein
MPAADGFEEPRATGLPPLPRVLARVAAASSLLLLAALPLLAWLAPAGFAALLAKDGRAGGTGAVENLTVLALLPGIAAGAWALLRGRIAPRPARVWLGLWVAACVYFAGEEASWGQWWFGWETPAALAELNDQGEANLHNVSSWLDQKPRALVELFVVLAGVVGPLARRAGWRRAPRAAGAGPAWHEWVLAPGALLPAALPFVLVRVAGWLLESADASLGSSELREFALAWFLAWYLGSFAARALSARRRPAGPPARGSA